MTCILISKRAADGKKTLWESWVLSKWSMGSVYTSLYFCVFLVTDLSCILSYPPCVCCHVLTMPHYINICSPGLRHDFIFSFFLICPAMSPYKWHLDHPLFCLGCVCRCVWVCAWMWQHVLPLSRECLYCIQLAPKCVWSQLASENRDYIRNQVTKYKLQHGVVFTQLFTANLVWKQIEPETLENYRNKTKWLVTTYKALQYMRMNEP